ncbi:MAG: OmpA family protein [Paludibacter sp.]|nr:OmpA family protein [Paludibacter sp.]
MKRFLLLVYSLLIFTNVFSEGKDFSKWSVTAEYGLNYVFGDYIEEVSSPLPPTYGLTVEYGLTPAWGLAVDFYNFPYKGVNGTKTASFTADLICSDLNATINFTKLVFPYSHSKFSFNGSIGVGVARYSTEFTQPYAIGGINHPIIDSITPQKLVTSIPVSFLFEYNLTNQLALGVRAHYRAYMTDNLEGAPVLNWKGSTNDYIAAITLSARYKFGAGNKDHVRNISVKDFEPNEALDLVKATNDRVNKLGTALSKLEKKVDNQGRRIDSIQVFLSNDGADSDGDGVPDQRDRGANTPPNTAVDFWGIPIPVTTNIINNNNNRKGGNQTFINQYGTDDVPSVYFDFDRMDLDNDALETIGKVAEKLKADNGLMVEVRGYCDYVGKSPYNEKLSIRRAERVKAEMVKMWKIKPERIIINGKGRILEPRAQYRPNRRCDLFLSK